MGSKLDACYDGTMMMTYPREVVMPLVDGIIKVREAPLPPDDTIHLFLDQSEWELALKGLLWDAGKNDESIPGDLWSDIMELDPNFENSYRRGVAVREAQI